MGKGKTYGNRKGVIAYRWIKLSFFKDRGILFILLIYFNLTVTQKTITIGISSISYTGYQRRRGIVRKLDLQRAAGGCEAAGRFPQLALEFSPEAQKRG